MDNFYQQAGALAERQAVVIAMVVKSPDDNLGEKAIYGIDDYILTGKSQKLWQDAAFLLSAVQHPTLLDIGDTSIFAERLGGTPRLIICGGGHISLPVSQLGKMIGFEVTVIDDRPDFANTARFPQVDHVICCDFAEALASIPVSNGNYYVIVTRGHQADQICLRTIIKQPAAYIGMIGSKRRVKLVKDGLLAEGITQEALDELHSPIGLPIGAETPEEIAVCILAEIIQTKNQGSHPGKLSSAILKALVEPEWQDLPKALVTIIKRQGSAPRAAGTKMLVLADGHCIDTIGGGCVEAEVRQQALMALDSGIPRRLRVDITGKNAADDGMVCGGIVEVFIEPLKQNGGVA